MDLNEPVFWDKNNKRLGRNSTILSSDLHQIWQLFTKLYSAVYMPKPILQTLGNPDGLKFTIRDGCVEVSRPD